MGERILEVRNLCTSFFTHEGEVKAVNDVSFHIDEQEIVAFVGESGCGKTVTQLSLLQIVPAPPGKITGGEVFFKGRDLLQHKPNSPEMRSVRGAGIAMIFQEPMTSLNPVFTVGHQLTDIIMLHRKVGHKEAWEMGIEALRSVEIPEPEVRMRNYPFELSGGMRQRVMIAMAVYCNPDIIIADEPTTALDVTTQAQVLELLVSLVKQHRKSLIIVTHNLGVVTRYVDRIYVMYAGRIIESGSTEEIMTKPRHPYTIGLLNSVPKIEKERSEKLIPIKGAPPWLIDMDPRCTFLPRCSYACEVCETKEFPKLRRLGESDHFIACHRDIAGSITGSTTGRLDSAGRHDLGGEAHG
ncbi:MAG: ABC transporter ATP-binding protein [Firmicutes bacterium]|jgi:oligopeptide/dipeptide ABC transporter ATP-binding protein|nr:ABC transporter ATP-binding protein [Bacillota bacterium]NLL87749.1 ABC transporter ATP-binding protein [Bacillota bacterium]